MPCYHNQYCKTVWTSFRQNWFPLTYSLHRLGQLLFNTVVVLSVHILVWLNYDCVHTFEWSGRILSFVLVEKLTWRHLNRHLNAKPLRSRKPEVLMPRIHADACSVDSFCLPRDRMTPVYRAAVTGWPSLLSQPVSPCSTMWGLWRRRVLHPVWLEL